MQSDAVEGIRTKEKCRQWSPNHFVTDYPLPSTPVVPVFERSQVEKPAITYSCTADSIQNRRIRGKCTVLFRYWVRRGPAEGRGLVDCQRRHLYFPLWNLSFSTEILYRYLDQQRRNIVMLWARYRLSFFWARYRERGAVYTPKAVPIFHKSIVWNRRTT